MPKSSPTLVRFWAKVNKEGPVPAHRPDLGPCWLWTGGQNRHPSGNYGQLWVTETKRKVYAHRFSYELVHGPVPAGLDLDHLCRVRLCCNPRHLEAVTRKVNLRRGKGNGYKAKTHCLRNHVFDEANTRISGRGTRDCRACQRLRNRPKVAA